MIVHMSRNPALVAALVLSCVIVALFHLPDPARRWFLGELGLLESLTALCYLAAFVTAIRGAKASPAPGRHHFALWAVLCFVFFGEETSWLQHYLRYETPESLAEANNQGEFNFHNLKAVTSRNSFVAWLEEGGNFHLGLQHVFNAGFTAYFLGLAALNQCSGRCRALIQRIGLPVASGPLLCLIFVPIGTTLLLQAAVSRHAILMEYRELMYSLSILAFLVLWGRQASYATVRQ